MITEWFVQFLLGVVDFFLGWLPESDSLSLPDFGPLFGLLQSADFATAGFISETFAVIAVLLTVNLALFLFATIRQVWRFVPIIGGG